jgi:tetratricopeptide (TPR) repeat protein
VIFFSIYFKKYAEAETLLKKALALSEKAFNGQYNPAYATSLNNLAGLYKLQRKYSRSEPLYKHALEIRRKVLGPNHPDVATSLSNLATLYFTLGKYAMAEQLFKLALEILDKTLEPGHQDIATLLNNLITLYTAQGRHSMAKHYHSRLQSTWDIALKSQSSATLDKQETVETANTWKGHVYSSKFSRTFHRPDCTELQSSPDDIIDFQAREYAIRDGAIPCSACKP